MTTPADERGEFTRLLERVRDGDEHASDLLLAMAYDTLKEIARRQLSLRRRGSALSTTELVHEAYFKLAGRGARYSQDRAHFCGIAANAMRQVLVDHARSRLAAKRGGGVRAVTFSESVWTADFAPEELLALDAALGRLEERQRRVVECRFFAGMEEKEIAEALGVTERTVRRDWAKARAWLVRWMSDSPPD